MSYREQTGRKMTTKRAVNGYSNKALLDDTIMDASEIERMLLTLVNDLNDANMLKRVITMMTLARKISQQISEVRGSYDGRL